MKYTGWYSYNEKKEVFGFDVKKYEPTYIFGEGKDEGGAFSVEIKIKSSLFLTMKKIYHGAHTVHYYGRCFKSGNDVTLLRGVWEIPEACSGDFELKQFK